MIGKTVMVDGRGLRIAAVVLKERRIFGRHEVLITPERGEGEKWVRLDSVSSVPMIFPTNTDHQYP